MPTQWYAIWTRSRHEKYVRDQLIGQGIEPLLPLIKKTNQWKDRTKEVEVPLFPGYCFARFEWKERLNVLKATGVVRIIGNNGRPEPISENEIEAVKRLMTTTLPYASHPYLQEGMKVRIIHGPLKGIEGILCRKDNRHRVVLSVQLIRQAAAVEMDLADLAPL